MYIAAIIIRALQRAKIYGGEYQHAKDSEQRRCKGDFSGGSDGRFKISYANAVTEFRLSGSPGLHQSNWNIIFFKNRIDPLTSYQRKIIAAHEIGHVYGLGEVWNSSQVMYGVTPTASTKITASDIKGIQLMTHEHTCSADPSENTYGWVDGTFHRKRCRACSSFVYEVHTNGSSCTLC